MTNYFEKTEYVLDKIFFRYKDASYKGQGIMMWEPDSGFHIEASVKIRAGKKPRRITFGGTTIETIPNILLKPQGYDRAVAIPVVPINPISIFANQRLSINCDRVFFFQHSRPAVDIESHTGLGLYHMIGEPLFPDVLKTETYINKHKIQWSVARKAIWHDGSQRLKLSGYMVTDDTMELRWVLSDAFRGRGPCWKFAEGVRYALSVLTGQTVQLLQREMEVKAYKRIERHKLNFARSLLIFTPFPDNIQLNKNDFIKLTEFFTMDSKEAYICRNIFDQMAEASRQQTLQGAQLLLSTILEATLRTLYNHPFVQGDRSPFPKREYIKEFVKSYLSKEWTGICDRALTVFERLRHRNAHPCWLISNRGNWSKESFEEDINDMAFLSQFYGYMIKALAGFKNLEPKFKL